MDVNEAPSAITLSNNNVKENSAIDTVIANVTVTDPDNEGAYAGKQRASCSVSSDPSGIFGIKDDVTLVVVKASLNYERISRYVWSEISWMWIMIFSVYYEDRLIISKKLLHCNAFNY